MLEMLELWEKCGMIDVLIDMCSRAMYHFRGRCGFPRNPFFLLWRIRSVASQVACRTKCNISPTRVALHLSRYANHGSCEIYSGWPHVPASTRMNADPPIVCVYWRGTDESGSSRQVDNIPRTGRPFFG